MDHCGISGVLTGWCLLGGGSRIVKGDIDACAGDGLAYIGMALIVVIINIRNVPEMFLRIFEEAFDFKAIFERFCKCQPSGQTGTGSDAVCLYRHTSSLHGNGDDVYVVWH